MVIPFSTLKFKRDSVQVWGINFERNIRRKKEQLMWQGWSRLYDVEKILQGGKLTGINNIKQGTKIEIKPYVLGGFQFSDEKPKNTGKIGGEINFDITPTLKLNFSVNTDFAQVKSDRKQINLTRFSLYYPEKRQFFLEGKNYYDMNVGGVRLFYYSRRIGIIVTQKYSAKHYNRVYGTDFTYSTSELFGEKNLLVGGAIAVSETNIFGETENLNSDNLTYDVFLSYPNDVIEYDLGFTTVESGFNPEMGFTRRKNYQMLYTELQFNPRFKKLPFFRNLIFKPILILINT